MNTSAESNPPVLDIAILCQKQFGSHVDTYYYCKYLSRRHRVTYICWDYGSTRQGMDKVAVQYVSRNHSLIVRNLLYIYVVCAQLRRQAFDVCFIKYFRGCSILPLLFPRVAFIFDIRSGSISRSWLSRFICDNLLKFESRFFKHVTVISASLRRKLGLEGKAHILPVGSISLSVKEKEFGDLHLLYVGTLYNRNIDRTIPAFARFAQNHSQEIKCTYTIIGAGPGNEEEILRSLAAELGVADRVHVVGRVPFEELGRFFDTHNVGVSFVPMTSFYDVQPVTKTFDYLLSGMVVLATATSENKLVIDESNGVLIDDTSADFFLGLEKVMAERAKYKSAAILENALKYHRDTISRELERSMLEKIGFSETGEGSVLAEWRVQ